VNYYLIYYQALYYHREDSHPPDRLVRRRRSSKEPVTMTDSVTGAQSALPGGAAAGHWVLDPAKSGARFQHKTFWGLMTVRGHFAELSGAGDLGADGSVTGEIQISAASLDTKNAKRDKHLRSADFFNADAHPSITFTAKSAALSPAGDLAVSGDLHVAGTSRPLSVTMKVGEAAADSATLEVSADIDRADFGMTWNQAGMLKGPAAISVTAHFVRQPA
jgi:polyisoprenoid-binding protein YceI